MPHDLLTSCSRTGAVGEDRARAFVCPRGCLGQRNRHAATAGEARYALRVVRHNLTFTVVVVLTLALGIGANAAVLPVLDSVKPLSYPQAEVSRSSAGDLRRRRCFPLRDVEFMRGENEELFARLKKSGGHVMRTGVDQARPVFIRQFSRGPAAH